MKFVSYLNSPNGYFLDQISLEAIETKMMNKGLGIFHPLQKFPETFKAVADWFPIFVGCTVGWFPVLAYAWFLPEVVFVAEPLEPV
jgi:hypothetical protein